MLSYSELLLSIEDVGSLSLKVREGFSSRTVPVHRNSGLKVLSEKIRGGGEFSYSVTGG